MSKIKFENIHPDIVPVLKELGITEDDLFNHNSDLLIGCKDYKTALIVKNSHKWEVLTSIFAPQKGSDMEKYVYGVDIAFGAMDHDFKQKYPNYV